MHYRIVQIIAVAGIANTASAFVPVDLATRAATACKSPYGSGLCANTATACGGVYLPGYCPGAANIQCCITTPIKCATPDGNGLCGDTDRVCGGGKGFYSAGYCPGPNDVQCCVPTSPDPEPSENDGEDGATVDKNPTINTDANVMDDNEVVKNLQEEGLDGEFDEDGNSIATRGLDGGLIAELEAGGVLSPDEVSVAARDLDDLAPRAAAKTKGQLIYAAAAKQLGVPYKWGGGNCKGKTKGGFDCSGLVLHAVCKVTKKVLPHKASAQYTSAKGRKVKWADKRQGDAIFWGCGSGIYHVGIVKNSTHFINAPRAGKPVRVQKYWGTPCKSAVRFW